MIAAIRNSGAARAASLHTVGRCRALLVFSIWLAALDTTHASAPLVLPLAFHVVAEDGHPVVSEAFLRERLARANAIFERYGVSFQQIAAPSRLPASHALVVTRQQRDAFEMLAAPGAIHCFVVRTLIDVDEPPRPRRGVHWRSSAGRRSRYIILSSIAEPDVLAHELGHYLGNPGHSATPGNLMSYERGDGLPFLDPPQRRRMRVRIRALLQRGQLRAQPRADMAADSPPPAASSAAP